jgi:hypothetical protein
LVLGLPGCFGTPQIDMMVEQSARGSVYLERIPDRDFQAAHPVRLAPDVVHRALRGVAVRDQSGILQSLGGAEPSVLAAFSDEDAAFLVPGIVDALSRAATDQQVGFRVNQTGSPGYSQRTGAGVGSSEPPLNLAPKETTSGSLFVYGRSIYITLREFRHRNEPPDTVNMPNRRVPDPTGLQHREVVFVPSTVLRPDVYAPAFAAAGGLKTLVLDQDRLIHIPLSPAADQPSVPAKASGGPSESIPSGTQAAPGDDLQQIRDDMRKKETELDELRKELQEIKRQLGESSRERSAPRR